MPAPASAAWSRRKFTHHFLTGLVLLAGSTTGVACSRATASPSPTTGTLSTAPGAASAATSTRIVAAENFYGDLASQIGGNRVGVVSLLSDPNADPHEYESNADAARAVANAQVVIENDLGYDAFIEKLMAASPRPNRIVLNAATINGRQQGDNPHIWYGPKTMPAVAQKLAAVLTQLDPAGKSYFASRLQAFQVAEKAVDDQIAAMRAKYQGTSVLATEPVFNYMAEALGLKVLDPEGAFQRAVEEGNDPPASAVAQFRGVLTSRSVKVLIYNSQTVTPITTQMQDLAKQNGISVVPVTETEPAGKTYQRWMLDELSTLQQALGG